MQIKIQVYNHGHNILELCSVLDRPNLPQVKRNLLSSTTNLIYDLPQELQNDLRLKILESPRHFRRWGRPFCPHKKKKKRKKKKDLRS